MGDADEKRAFDFEMLKRYVRQMGGPDGHDNGHGPQGH